MKMRNTCRTPGIVLLLHLALALVLTGCSGGSVGFLRSSTGVPTVAATADRTRTPVPPTGTAESPETETPSAPTAEPIVLHTPASTSIEPRVALSPTNGPGGTELRVVAAGFRSDTTVTLGLARHGGRVETTTTAQSNDDGVVVAQFVIPESAETGDLWLVVAQILGQPVQAVSNLFEVTEPRGAQSVEVDPGSATAGATLAVTGAGFPSETGVEIGFGPSGAEPTLLGIAQTHADGRVEATIEIPLSATAGEDWIVTVTTSDRAISAVSDPVTILAPAEPTATPEPAPIALPTPPATAAPITGPSVLVYLIALEDAGQSGTEIGCGDSVVPVTVGIEPTMGVLRAAMERLLSLEGPTYRETGLHNALHRSELSVGAINIAGGHATINLVGTLSVDGTCDGPRVKAQLEQTALQFSTVNRVTMTVNGQLLDSVLSQQ